MISAFKNPTNITMPKVIGYMSVDVAREYHNDLSQLKFLTKVPKGDIHLDLNHGIDQAVKRSTDDNNERIDLLLKFILNHVDHLKLTNTIISYRRTLISIMCSVYHNEHVCIVASLFKGSIYLCSIETPEEKQKRQTRSKQEKIFCAWGYKFEQYMLSDWPNTSPDFEKPVIENEEFSMFYHTTLGEHDLVYGAQIDGLLATNNLVPNPPSSNVFKENINYLENHTFVELKTNRGLHSARQEQSFKRFKMLRCWCQCYLANLKGLLVGFRDEKGIVKQLQCYNTSDIIEYCKNEWQPEPPIKFLYSFLCNVKNCLKSHPNASKSDEDPITLMFDVRGCASVNVSECANNQNNNSFDILPNWYISKIKINKIFK